MAYKPYPSVNAVAMRIAQLTAGGAPVTGARKGFVSDSQIKVNLGLNINSSQEFTQTNGDGNLIADVPSVDKIKNASITLDIARLDPEFLFLTTGGTIFDDGSNNAIGHMVPLISDATITRVCFEVWSRAYLGSAQVTDPFTSPNATYFHFVFPNVVFTQQPMDLALGITTPQLKGTGVENTAITANGPFNDWGARVAGKGGIQAVMGWFYDGTLPTITNDYVTVPSGS